MKLLTVGQLKKHLENHKIDDDKIIFVIEGRKKQKRIAVRFFNFSDGDVILGL